MSYDQRHGGPYDRGSSDAYYRRRYNPHFYKMDPHSSERVDEAAMTVEEREAYDAGYYDQKDSGDFKDWE